MEFQIPNKTCERIPEGPTVPVANEGKDDLYGVYFLYLVIVLSEWKQGQNEHKT